MSHTVYYTVFTTDKEIEYHVSTDRNEVERGEALSASVLRDSYHAIGTLERWFQSAKIYNQIPVQCTKPMTLPLVVAPSKR